MPMPVVSAEQVPERLLHFLHWMELNTVFLGIDTFEVVGRKDDVGKAKLLSLSDAVCSTRLTGLTSPLSPTSPHMHHPVSRGVSTLLDSTAAITLVSMAISVTRSPPAILRKTSFCISLNPTRFSNTAKRHVEPPLVKTGG